MEQAWDWISEIEASTAVVCPTADFALCDIAMCTLRARARLTASCGCQRMAASEHNPASVGITEAGVLAFSSSYRDLLEQCAASATCDVQADAARRTAGSATASMRAAPPTPASMGVDLVSFYAINPLYAAMDGAANQSLADHIGGFRCNGTTMLAACQGAPCYDVSYDAPVFDLQCVCPVTATTTDLLDLESGADGAACTTINADDEHRACAFSATADPLTMYLDAEALADVIAAVEAAATAGAVESGARRSARNSRTTAASATASMTISRATSTGDRGSVGRAPFHARGENQGRASPSPEAPRAASHQVFGSDRERENAALEMYRYWRVGASTSSTSAATSSSALSAGILSELCPHDMVAATVPPAPRLARRTRASTDRRGEVSEGRVIVRHDDGAPPVHHVAHEEPALAREPQRERVGRVPRRVERDERTSPGSALSDTARRPRASA